MERAGAFEEENLGMEKGWSRGETGHSCGWGNRKEKDQKPGESPISSEKCLSQETREPLDPMSHWERLKKQIWAELGSQYHPRKVAKEKQNSGPK